jgi:hypothetical protein
MIMIKVRRAAGIATLVMLLVAAVPAHAKVQEAFPRLRMGVGDEPTSGGGVVAGDRYVAHAAVVAWNRKWNNLTLYLLWRRRVTCQTLRRVISKPGHLIQVHVTSLPRVSVVRPVADPQVAFLTIYRNPNVPLHVAGLKHGAQLKFTRVDSYPGGVWHGAFKVPRRYYGDGKLYGYNGTFAAKWCELRY